MQVLVKLIDHAHRGLGERIFTLGIQFRQTHCKIGHPFGQGTGATARLVQWNPAVRHLKLHLGLSVSRVGLGNANVAHIGQDLD